MTDASADRWPREWVETAASASYRAEYRTSDEPHWDDLPATDQDSYRDHVRAILAALRDRTGAEEWSIRFPDGFVLGGNAYTRAGAQRHADERGAEPVRRWVGPWVEVPDARLPR